MGTDTLGESTQLDDLLAAPLALPSIPKVVALLLNELEHNEPDLKKINQLISTDPALTTRLLKVANSAYFRLSGRIHSVSESLALLGLGHVRAMASEAATDTSIKALQGFNLQQFWTYSVNVARIARALAGLVRQNPQAAFTSGLIHAIGELTLHVRAPLAMAALNREVAVLDLRRARAEHRALGYSWAQVGAGFARQWRFPQSIADALEHQGAPFENEVYEPLAGVIHLATWRARAREAGLSDRSLAVTYPGVVGEALGLDIDMVLQQDPIDWSAQA